MAPASGTSTPTNQSLVRRSARQAGIPVVQAAAPSPPLGRAGIVVSGNHQNATAAAVQGRSKQFIGHQLARKNDILPPFASINPGQARATTYPSRMRLGTTSLMQPLTSQGHAGGGASAGTAGSSAATVLGKRSRTTVNYAELQSLDDPGLDTDDSDAPSGTRSRRSRRGGEDYKGTPPPEGHRKTLAGAGKSFLGAAPPPHFVQVEQAKKTKHHWFTEDRLVREAESKVLLVPIRVELDTETHRIRDCFVWNTRERLITPDQFAQIFCDDLNLPLATYKDQIAQKIKTQIDEFSGVAEIDVVPPELAEDFVEADLRVIVNLDLQIGTLHLLDCIEWDLSSTLTPEHFARQLCLDLGISGEAAPMIAHAIHEELLRHKRDAIEAGLVGKTEGEGKEKLIVETQALNLRGPRRMEGVWREWQDAAHFGPRVEVLTQDDLAERDAEQDKSTKRIRRERPAAPVPRAATRKR